MYICTYVLFCSVVWNKLVTLIHICLKALSKNTTASETCGSPTIAIHQPFQNSCITNGHNSTEKKKHTTTLKTEIRYKSVHFL